MRSLKKLLLLLVGVTLVSPAQAAGILELADEADVVVLGKTVEVPNNSAETVKLSIAPEAVLKGSVGNSPLQLVFLKPGTSGPMSGFGPSFPPRPGTRAFWFLRRLPTGEYTGIPRAHEGETLTVYHKRSGSPVPDYWVPSIGASSVELLLASTLEFYRSNYQGPELGGTKGENWLIESLAYAHLYGARHEALEIVDRLLNATPSNERALGLLIGVRMSYGPALDRLTEELLHVEPRIQAEIVRALQYHLDITAGGVPALIERLIRFNRQARVPYLDTALAGTLDKLPVGAARLSLAALLLDSPEEVAVRHAAAKFSSYTRLVGADGKVSASGPEARVRPFDDERTRAHAGHNEDIPVGELATFWKQWWIDNQDAVLR